MVKKDPKIVVIGGGTGSFALLSGLKFKTRNLTALVSMADDGGSTGVLRDQFGVLPPGDVRQCLVALSQSSELLRELFNYRYPSHNDFAGHSFGNLFLSTVELMSKDFGEAVKLASEVLQITGEVVPVTLDKCHLVLETDAGLIKGQRKIATMQINALADPPEIALQPTAHLNPAAEQAIKEADLVVIAPGDLYGSLAPALLVDGIYHALMATTAKVVYVCNLVNKPRQTADFAVHDYVRELERIAGGAVIDIVLYNTQEPTKEVMEVYSLDGEFPVAVDRASLERASYQAKGAALLTRVYPERDPNDHFILRSLIRHDSELVSERLMELI